MADFNVSLSGPTEAGAGVVAPVRSATKMDTMSPLVNLAVGMTDIFMRNKAEYEKEKKAGLQQATIGNYTTELSKVAQAVETGQMNDTTAKLHQQKIHRQYVAAFPLLTEEFGKVNKNLTEYTTLADVKSESDMFKEVRKKQITDMANAGYPVFEGMPEQQLQSNLKAFQESTRAEGEFKKMAERKRLAISLSAEERSQFEFDQKQEANNLLAKLGDSHFESTMLNVKSLVEETAKSGDIQGGAFKLQQMFSGIDQTITALTSANPTAAGAYKQFFGELKKLGEEGVQGGKFTEASSNRLKLLENQVKFAGLSSSPEAKRLYASSYLFHGNMPATFMDMNTDGKNTYTKLGGAFGVKEYVSPENLNGTLSGVKSQVAEIKSGRVVETGNTYTQAGNVASNILKQIGNAGNMGWTPKELDPAVDFLGSVEFLDLHKQGKIDRDALLNAKGALQSIHEKSVVKGIDKVMKDIPASLIPVFNGNGVSFQITSEGSGADQQKAQQALFEANGVAKAINRLITAGAHMEGNSDYKSYWENNKHFLLPNIYPDPVKLKVGQVVDGYKYLGGNTKDQSSWEQVKE